MAEFELLKALSKRWNAFYKNLLKDYAATGFRFPFNYFVFTIFMIAVITVFILYLLHLSAIVSFFAFFAIMSLIVGIPLNIKNNRVASIEGNLPDVLKHMAIVMKSGGTTENAIDEVSNSGYGPLSDELKIALKQLREGRSFDEVLSQAAENSGSKLFLRTVQIVIDARKAGAGLADVMFAIAEDARDLERLKRERYSRTIMQVLFLSVSILVLSPFIFGFTISIVNYVGIGLAQGSENGGGALKASLCDLNFLLTMFIVAEAMLTTVALGIIREGKIFKYFLYTPIVVLVALLIFEMGKWISSIIISSPGIVC